MPLSEILWPMLYRRLEQMALSGLNLLAMFSLCCVTPFDFGGMYLRAEFGLLCGNRVFLIFTVQTHGYCSVNN